ncbi:MAG: acyltransferase family protein [Enterococcus sp.]|nr:acyltransferase family protein [Enterococcus sp.]
MQNRKKYIDFMKGLGITLIVSAHISGYMSPELLITVGVPVFYFTAGLVYRQSDNFLQLLKKKVNSLLIPFLFFFIVQYLLAFVCCVVFHLDEKGVIGDSWQWHYIFDPFYLRAFHYNPPVWFLLSLFEVNVLFYLMLKWLDDKWLYVFVTLAAAFGFYLKRFNLPLFFDSTLIAMPFFLFGYEAQRHSFTISGKFDWLGLFALIPCLYLLWHYGHNVIFLHNRFPSFFVTYIQTFSVLIVVFLFSKNMNWSVVFSHIGRYSLIILGSHTIVLKPCTAIVYRLMGEGVVPSLVSLIVIMAIECVIVVPLLIKFFPYFVSQKQLIK